MLKFFLVVVFLHLFGALVSYSVNRELTAKHNRELVASALKWPVSFWIFLIVPLFDYVTQKFRS